MEVAELVLKYIQALVWPVVALTLLWLWRHRVGEAIGRLSRVETPVGALEFQNDARRVRDRAELVAEEEMVPTGPELEPQPEREPQREPVPEPQPEPEPQREPVPEPQPEPEPQREPVPEPQPEPEPQEPPGEAVRRRLETLWSAIDQPDDVIDRSPTGAIVSAWNALQTFAEEILTLYPRIQPRRPGPGRMPPGELVRMLQAAGLDQDVVDVLNDLRRLRNTTVHGTAVVTPQAARDFIRGCKSAGIAMEDLTWPGPSGY
ncbi:hypothetical protein G3I20_25545 [Streptomyces sp. SID8111]|uniref:hypothetical protein n=1 Tax=Streptomyces sp. SID8111 TaxID=2706100 RepID=UPI0013BF1F73|nr:hypothetical protein [Streptomyces sp. SID8111]NEC29857.1 hypothetical protein [Streptomyces sp. SID8111]